MPTTAPRRSASSICGGSRRSSLSGSRTVRSTSAAAPTWQRVAPDPAVPRHAAPLAAAAREIGALQIQARATLGGNVGTSSPVGDSLPVLLALDAELELASAARGARRVAYREFCTGYRKTQLAA